MTQIRVHRLKCDGCEKELPVSQVSGWFHIEQVITSEEEYAYILARAERTGNSGILSGDFCSLQCLNSWSYNAQTLSNMEDLPTFEPPGGEDG